MPIVVNLPEEGTLVAATATHYPYFHAGVQLNSRDEYMEHFKKFKEGTSGKTRKGKDAVSEEVVV